jgi:hypothetical protein
MEYAAHSAGGGERETFVVSHGRDQSHTLSDAVRYVSSIGEDVRVVSIAGGARSELWFCEADTKVDDGDPWFPVIVHRRDGSTKETARGLAFTEDVAAMREP